MRGIFTIKKKLPLFFLLALLCIGVCNIHAQTIVTVGGGATVTCPATPTATWSTPPTGVTFSNWSRGAGVTCGTASTALSGSGFNTANAAASFAAGKYFSVTLTADATHTFTLNSVVWSTAVSSGGANFTVQYSNNGGALTTFGTAAQTNTSSNTFSGTVSVAAGTSIILYLIPAGTGATGTTVRWVNGSTITVTAAGAGTATLSPTTQNKGPYCNGGTNSISLDYTTTGSVTSPYIELSNSAGSFASGTVNLGGTVSGGPIYTITGTIPSAQTASTAYRIRVNSSNSVISANNNSDITITATPSVPTSSTPAAVCEGVSATITGAGATTYTFWDAPTSGSQYVTGGGYSVSSSSLSTPTTLTAGSYNYYVQGENATCSSSSRQLVTVTVNNCSVSITTSSLSTTAYCTGDAISIPYTTTGTFTGNTFTAQISKSSTFSSGNINVGTLLSNTDGTVTGAIPGSTAAGTYYVRVNANSPSTTGTPSVSTITITLTPTIPTASTPAAVCEGNTVAITGTGSTNATSYSFWSASTGGTQYITGTPAGYAVSGGVLTTPSTLSAGSYTYYVEGDNGSCPSTRQAVTVTINATPAAPVATAGTFVGSTSFSANWNSVAGATGYYVDVYSDNVTTAAAWTFPLTGLTVTDDIYSANNSGQNLTTNGGSISSVSGATTQAPSASAWAAGAASKYWQVDVNTVGFTNLKLSSKQQSSNTGPRDFKVQYKIGAGSWTDVTGGTVTLANNFTTGVITNLALPAACEGQSALSIRWIMTTNTSVVAGSVANGGTSRIDDIYISGNLFAYVPGFQNVYTTGTTLDVTDLTPSTTYNYIVRADNALCTSVNSNEITVTTDLPCVASVSVSGFNPTSGPVATRVTITGSSFTGATSVKFGNISATSFTVVDDNTIIAQVPAAAPFDYINVKGSDACIGSSPAKFTLLTDNGSCNTSNSSGDLYISEVYDASSGGLSYIEIFNPTLSTVPNLSSYTVREVTIGSNGGSSITDYPLTSTSLNSGAVKILSFGTSAITCPVTTTWTNNSGPGINGNDQILLLKSGSTIDKVNNPNYGFGSQPGFSQVRKPTAVGPTTIYNASDWIISGTEDCSNLGVAPFVPGGTSVTITTHPADLTCANTITLSVAATTSTGSSNYTWYYNDPSSMSGWSAISSLPAAYPVTGAGTSSISISGSTAELSGYQFYVQVGSVGAGQCVRSSNAAQYKPDSKLIYRTISNGAWNNASVWEMSDVLSGPWISACTYPIAKNSDEAIVRNYITLPVNVSIDKVTINSGDTLEISTTSLLNVLNGHTGADLVVAGAVYDRGSTSNGISYEDNAGTANDASWSLGTSGTVIKSNNSSTSRYRDFYEGGIVNMPLNATWIFRYNGDGNPSVVASGMYFPNLYFENKTGAAFSFNSSQMAMSGGVASTSVCTVNGSLNIGTTGTSAVTVYNNNISSLPMLINGNLSIGTGSILTNTSFDGATDASHGNGTGFEIKGNITNNGTFTNNSNNTGLLKLSGTTNQDISGTGSFNLYNVSLNKTAQTIVDQKVNLTVNNNLNFVGGIIKTNSNIFSVTNPSIAGAITGYDAPNNTGIYNDDRYVSGNLERAINTTGYYDFPIGDDVAGIGYNPVQLNIATGVGKATAKFVPGDPGSCNTLGKKYFTCSGVQKFVDYSDMTGQGWWNFVSSTGTTFTYDIYLHPNLPKNGNDHPNQNAAGGYTATYRALKGPTGTGGLDFTPYVLDGDPCIVSNNYFNIVGAGYSGFSDFAPGGGTNPSSALPVELTSFTGSCVESGRYVSLSWTTASERNSSQYILQRSTDGKTFINVAEVSAAGFSNGPKNYSVIDSSGSANNYYRLREIDFDGTQTIYSLIQVRCGEPTGTHIYYAAPKIVVEVSSNMEKLVSMNVFDVSGKLLYKEDKNLQRGYNKFNLDLHKQLSEGIYIIEMIDGTDVSSTKIMVH